MRNYFDKSSLEAALAYSRWLNRAKHIEWINVKNAECGLPPESTPICLNAVGERVYKDIRASLREQHQRGKRGAVMLDETERREVVNEILDQMHEVKR